MQWTSEFIIPLLTLLEKEIIPRKPLVHIEEHNWMCVSKTDCFSESLTSKYNTCFRQKEAH